MEEQRNAFPRRAVLFGVPIIYVVLGLLQPTSNPEPQPLGCIAYFGAGLLFLAVALSIVRALWLSGGYSNTQKGDRDERTASQSNRGARGWCWSSGIGRCRVVSGTWS